MTSVTHRLRFNQKTPIHQKEQQEIDKNNSFNPHISHGSSPYHHRQQAERKKQHGRRKKFSKGLLLLVTSIFAVGSISVWRYFNSVRRGGVTRTNNKTNNKIEPELHLRAWSFRSWSYHRRQADHDKYKVPTPGTQKGNDYYAPSPDQFPAGVPLDRKSRFPSVQQRIRFYMGEFYDPPRSVRLVGEEFRKKIFGHFKTSYNIPRQQDYMIDSVMANPLSLDYRYFMECAEYMQIPAFPRSKDGTYAKRTKLWEPKVLKQNYCRDAVDLLLLWEELRVSAPLLLHFKDFIPVLGEKEDVRDFPLFNKVRDLTGGARRGGAVPEGKPYHCIIWPLNRRRHLVPPAMVVKDDRPWHKKKGGVLIWRGDYNVADPSGITANVSVSGPLQKWILVSKYNNSTKINAKYFSPEISTKHIPKKFISTKQMHFKEMLTYKYLLSLEGHDMSSGLKWMLYSNSLLFLTTITYDSWAMESLLKPWVHYVPVHANMTNVEEMVQWAEENQINAKEIADRGKLFAYDLLYHPDAVKDEEDILRGMVERYEQNFGWFAVSDNAGALRRGGINMLDLSEDLVRERRVRFPSVEDRVINYMGLWYEKTGPCMEQTCYKSNTKVTKPNILSSFTEPQLWQVEGNTEFIVTDDFLSNPPASQFKHPLMKSYRHDLVPDFLSKKIIHQRSELHDQHPPLKIVRFGDGPTSVSEVPIFVKHRRGSDNSTVGRGAIHPGIIWQFHYPHEYEVVLSDLVLKYDMPFDKKRQTAFWRGGTGVRSLSQANKDEFQRRRDFVLRYRTVSLVNAELLKGSEKAPDIKPDTIWIDDISHKEVQIKDTLRWKYVVVLEDDYRSNPDLKWILLSNSIVLMPPDRKFTTWFMEDMLQPFIHYVPIKPDLSNVAEIVSWCELNQEKMQRILERSSLYVYDMLFHPKADQDNAEVKLLMMSLYNEQFKQAKKK